MNNPLAIELKEAADSYFDRYKDAFSDNAEIFKGFKKDYKDLIKIANMIEKNNNPAIISRAMGRLDTAVREIIPDKTYYAYNN